MGWRGAVRSIGTAIRAAERDAQRRHKAALKSQMVADAQEAVGNWESYIDDLLSIHTNLADEINWAELANSSRPIEPIRERQVELKARQALESFRPSFFGKLFGQSVQRRQQLELELARAPDKDEVNYRAAISRYEKALSEWQADTDLARRLLRGETEAILQVIDEFQSLSKESLIGSNINFKIAGERVHAIVRVHTDEIVPNVRRKQLASGRLSESKMPTSQFNEIYQDYVCSVAIKVAGDLFRILPQKEVYVTCETEMLDTSSGHKQARSILSVQFVHETFSKLNLKSIDPSDAMKNFNHRMQFTKAKGFIPVEPLV